MVESETLILIGYWYSDEAPQWPDPADYVDAKWDGDDRDLILDHLARGFVVRACMGFSPCRMCDQPNGALELTDGVFVWPEGLHHYVEEHRVRLPDRFVDHVIAKADRTDDVVYDLGWWRSFGYTG